MSDEKVIVAVAIAAAILMVGISLAWFIANSERVAITPQGQVVALRS